MPLKRRTQKMFDSVTERIKNQTQSGLKVNPETGVRYEEPLEEKHPGLAIGVMAAQPGTIIEKILAPSVYKGMAKSIGEGNLSEALMAGIAPVKVGGTVRLYRATGTSGKFTSSVDGTKEFTGQWFTNNPRKPQLYASRTAKTARLSGEKNPIELQYIDIPKSEIEKYSAKNILNGRTDIEFEPTEDFLIPLDYPRNRVPMEGYTGNLLKDARLQLPIPTKPISEFERNGKYTLEELHSMGYKLPRKHLQGEDAVQMFKEYGVTDIPENSQLVQQLRKYIPEARERYGLVENANITDDEIVGSLYKKALELGEDTAAVNEIGEPLVLFRGDTKRFPALKKVVEPENLAKDRGSMDNSFGNLFLGQLDRPGEGVERYIHYVYQNPGGATRVFPSATGERLIWNGNKIREQGADIYIPEKYLTYDISSPFSRYGQSIRRRKISSELAKPNSNDINAFVVRTPSVRNASTEISPEMGGEFVDINGVPKFKNSNDVDRNQAAVRIRQILTDAKSKNQGLLKSDAYSPLRKNEHFEYDYYALPNFNILGAKHLLPYDFRVKPHWGSKLIYREHGGELKRK